MVNPRDIAGERGKKTETGESWEGRYAAVLHEVTREDLIHCLLILSYLTLSYLTLPYLTLPYLILSYLILSYLILSYLILSYLILSYLILSYLILSYLILSYLSRSLADRWGTTVDFTTSFLHSSRFSAFRSMMFYSRPVHSLMLSSHRFLCLPLRLLP